MKVMSSVSRGIDKWEIRKGERVKVIGLCLEHFGQMSLEKVELGRAFGSEKKNEFRGLDVRVSDGDKCLVCWEELE